VALLFGLMATSVAPAKAVEPTDVVSWGAFHGFDVRTPAIGPTGAVAIASTDDGGILTLKGDGMVVAAWGATNPPAGLTSVTKIATNGYINLALKADGTVVGWSYPHSSAPAVPAGLTGVVDIAVGGSFAVALKSDGTVVAWGDNSKGQTNVPAALTGVTAIATGAYLDYALAIKSNGAVVAWGTSAPAVPRGLTGVVSVAPGDGYVLALKSDGTVTAWGSDPTGTAVPGGLNGVASVVAATNGSGTGQGFAVKTDGTVVDWGGGDYCDDLSVPAGLANVISIVTDGSQVAAILSDGTVHGWGGDCSFWEYGVPGYPGTVAAALDGEYGFALMADGEVFRFGGASINYSQPSNLQGATLIDAGAGHELVTMGSGAIVPWGDDTGAFQIDIDPALLTGVTHVSAGGDVSFGLKSDGTVVFLDGISYPPSMTNPYLPPAGLSGVTAIDAGGGASWGYVLARKSDGTVVAWGDSYGGQTTVPASLSGVTAVSAGGDCALALKSKNTVVGWGDNCPAVPTGLIGVTAISAGGDFNLALKSDHTVVAWGSNAHGQATVPGGLTSVTAIAAGYDFALALKSDGTVVAWGNDDQGQIDIPAGLGNVTSITAGDDFASVIFSAPPAAASVTVSGIGSPRYANVTSAFTVNVRDGSGNLAYGYRGTIHFTSSDGSATLPTDYTFSGADHGTHVFIATLATVGTQSVTATDTVTGSLTGTQSGIGVTAPVAPGAPTAVRATPSAGSAVVSWMPPTSTGGRPVTGYTVTSTPDGHTCTTWGTSCRVTGLNAGSTYYFTATATNIVGTGTASAHSNTAVPVGPAVALSAASYPSSTNSGIPHSLTVTAKDAHGNIADGYSGTVHFTATDLAAVLPSNYTFTVADGGVHVFSVTLNTAGTRSITVTDTSTASITGSQSVTVTPATATHFTVSTANPYVAGVGHTVTVTALDAYGNTATGYLGTIHFTSTDSKAVLPADYTFVAGDKGVHAFSGGLSLKTAGSRSVTATDTVTASITGSQTVTVTPGAATHLSVSTANPYVAGVGHTVTVSALDAYGNTATGYRGTIHFTSSDTKAVLPANYTFVAADNGVHAFSGGLSLKTAGSRSVTATDTGSASISGSTTVTVTVGAATHFSVSTANPYVAGVGHTVTVTAQDAYGNTATGYRGTIHFTSSDPAAVLPANYTFTAADNGTHAFSGGLSLKTPGSRSVTAADTGSASISGSTTVTVTWTVTLEASATNVTAGTQVTLTARANEDVLPTPYYLVIVAGDNSVAAVCGSGTTCSGLVTSAAAGSQTYSAVVGTSSGGSPQATSGQVTVTWTAVVPNAPSNISATATNSSTIHVTWSDNSGNETGFRLGDGTTTFTVGAGTTSYDWTGLAGGTYKCTEVQAYNSAGSSAWTSWGCTTTPQDAAASVLTNPAPGSQLPGSSVTFQWTAGVLVSSHLLYVGDMSQGVANLYASPTLSGATTSWTVTGLPTDGRTLYVTLYSMLPTGWAINYYTYAAAQQTVPSAPSNISSTATNSSTIHVTWSDNSNNETGFRISDNINTFTLAAGTTSYDWTGLAAGTYKCTHVQAYNSAGSSAWTSWGCTTTPVPVTVPSAPSNISATATNSSTIHVTWSDNSNNETGFRLGDGTTTFTVGAGTTSYNWTGLAGGTYKCTEVQAYNSAGSSAWTSWGCATTPTGSATREQNAITWATGQVGSTGYEGYCELFAENAFGTSGRYASAIANYNAMNSRGTIHAGDTNVPAGALAFFGATSSNGNYGHVMLSLGNGQFISTNVGSSGYLVNSGHVGYTTIAYVQASSGPYLGWSYADSGWAGR
jgi:alpha-tubulin suppressor-like RCC1 family protein